MGRTANFKADEFRSLPTGVNLDAKYDGPENNGVAAVNEAGTIQTGENPVPEDFATTVTGESLQNAEHTDDTKPTKADRAGTKVEVAEIEAVDEPVNDPEDPTLMPKDKAYAKGIRNDQVAGEVETTPPVEALTGTGDEAAPYDEHINGVDVDTTAGGLTGPTAETVEETTAPEEQEEPSEADKSGENVVVANPEPVVAPEVEVVQPGAEETQPAQVEKAEKVGSFDSSAKVADLDKYAADNGITFPAEVTTRNQKYAYLKDLEAKN